VLGKVKERDYLAALYERRDFTLLDDNGDFFQLSSLPRKKLALLVFTPDGIPPRDAKPFHEFSLHLGELRGQGIEALLVSRTNREIAKNFKRATRFPGRLLLDTGGSVGRNAGIWPGIELISYWGYALVDNEFHVLWTALSENAPLGYEKLIAELKSAR
jgi:peroxiredoxin